MTAGLLVFAGSGIPAALHGEASKRGSKHAGLETGNLSEFDQATSVNGSLGVSGLDPEQGRWSAEAVYSGGGDNGYARGIFHVGWRPGDRVSYSAAFRLPPGFYSAQQGQVALMRWDNWPLYHGNGDVGGVVIYGSDKRARLVRGRYGGEQTQLGGSFELPEGRWFKVSVLQRFSKSRPVSKVRVDGRTVSVSRRRNFYGRRIDRIRYGVVAIAAGTQTNRLQVWFDQAEAERRR